MSEQHNLKRKKRKHFTSEDGDHQDDKKTSNKPTKHHSHKRKRPHAKHQDDSKISEKITNESLDEKRNDSVNEHANHQDDSKISKKLPKEPSDEKNGNPSISEDADKDDSKTPDVDKRMRQSVKYLLQWDTTRDQWKFNKMLQTWLIKHAYDPKKIARVHFLILLRYIEGLQGNARLLVKSKAIEVSEKFTTQEKSGNPISKDLKRQNWRAINILSALIEET